jgi:multidrug efflux pump subunit AcrB
LAVLTLPPAASLERTNEAMSELTRIARQVPGVDGVVQISGFNLLTRQSVSYSGTAFIRFKPWDQRKTPDQSVDALVKTLNARLNSAVTDASVLVFNPPPIRGLSTAGGFTFVLQNRGGANAAEFSQVLQNFLAQARKRPEIGFAYSAFDARVPQIELTVAGNRCRVRHARGNPRRSLLHPGVLRTAAAAQRAPMALRTRGRGLGFRRRTRTRGRRCGPDSIARRLARRPP